MSGDEITFTYPGYPGDVFRSEQDPDGNLTFEPISVGDPVWTGGRRGRVWTRIGDVP